MSNYPTKKDPCYHPKTKRFAKKDFITLKIETDELDVNKFVNVNSFIKKVDDLDVCKLQT